MLILIIFSLYIGSLNAVLYDCYSGKPATKRQLAIFEERNNTKYCVIDVKPCDPDEWSRVDGSCNNLRYPSRGTIRTPSYRVLTPDFSPNYEPRKAKSGKSLPLARYIRTHILLEGKATEMQITQLVVYYLLFCVNDVVSIHDVQNYIVNTTTCCLPEGKSNYICTPNKMPVDDPVHRYSGVKCQNLTRPHSFQYFGCVDFGTTPFARISYATPHFDLSGLYNLNKDAINNLRTFKKGLMKIEIDHGKMFPLSNPNKNPMINLCEGNILPRETRCNYYQVNGVIGSNIIFIIFYRQHNYIAHKLAEMNPCWDDDRIFYTARDINVAIYLQLFLYELLPVILGKRNLIRDGVISCSKGFRDMYDENIQPQVSDEYVYIHRWFHTVQEADLKLYDKDGYFLRTFPMVNLTARTGILPLDDTIDQLIQGSFRQHCGGFDHVIDNDLSERILGYLQYASDGAMNDLAKGRFFGFPPYIKYREFCSRKPCKSFESLRDVMTKERIFQLTEVYKDVEDVELMAAAWIESHMRGARVPHTVYCLMVEQLKRTMAFDRHWYESSHRPHAFTLDQLKAIRNVKIAGVLCTHGDGVTKIQPNAFYTITSDNPLTDCSSSRIGKLNLSPWQDKCSSKHY